MENKKNFITFQGLGTEGWLGNQLFQICATIGTALENDMDFVFPNWKYSNYYVKNFPQMERSVLESISKKVIGENSFDYTKINILDKSQNYSLTGYFQTYKYFESNMEEVLSYFKPKEEYLTKLYSDFGHLLSLDKTCSIHFRGGDYRNFPHHHPLCGIDYYNRAMSMLDPEMTYLVFSDEMSTVREMFDGEQFHFIDYSDKSRGGDIILEHILMSMCKNNITANSSFSLWAAMLNNNPEKIVISPSKWFGSAMGNPNLKDLYVPNSIII